MEKIKISTKEQHDESYIKKERGLLSLPNISKEQYDEFENNCRSQGWYTAGDKIKAMIENYNYGIKTGNWKNLPYASD